MLHKTCFHSHEQYGIITFLLTHTQRRKKEKKKKKIWFRV